MICKVGHGPALIDCKATYFKKHQDRRHRSNNCVAILEKVNEKQKKIF